MFSVIVQRPAELLQINKKYCLYMEICSFPVTGVLCCCVLSTINPSQWTVQQLYSESTVCNPDINKWSPSIKLKPAVASIFTNTFHSV